MNEMESELMAHHEDAPQILTLDVYTTCLDRETERTPASQRETEFAGTQFTCFPGTKVQILTQERMPALGEASHSSAGSATSEGGAGHADAVAPKSGAQVSRMSWMLDVPPLS